MDMSVVMSAMNQAMSGIKKLNEINNLPPEQRNTEQALAARRAAIMTASTAIAAAIGSAVAQDHAKGAMIGAAVGGVAAMIIEEAQNNKPNLARRSLFEGKPSIALELVTPPAPVDRVAEEPRYPEAETQ
jgi:hypothetical protein